VEALISRVEKDEICKLYHIATFQNADQMLGQVARKKGLLKSGGVANLEEAARSVLRDFLNGKIKYFTAPPVSAMQGGDSDEEMI